MLLAFLVLVLPMITAQPGSINGRCDAEICVCILPAIVSCPKWFGRISDGGVYKQTISKTCGRDNICGGWMYDTLTPFPVTDSSCSGDTSETSKFDYWALLDGNLTSATLLMNYTEQDPPPACSLDIPFTFTPSMQPTTSPAPTAEPSMSGSRPAGQGLGRTTLVASVGLAGIVAATMLVIY
eukprot:CAMPEP_0113476578 /NCGR_PEP_ID=MMETSP0014_2-20120614/19743_1 /TAXON_ID=2857 /ORGANISM="Nitzschia sp." /LENGTH=181 /DNA_ID=CAMNT_0000369603 /DNA_START=514 /DNA_END=1059 /DNA_ORIENTATION=+ /assembly_acc=CAM_ASM_000159